MADPAPSLTIVDGLPRCHHFDAHRCGSCTLMGVAREQQLSDKERHARSLVDAPVWLPAVAGADVGFRNKAKMAVGGTVDAPTLGILDRDLAGIDLHDCGLHSAGLRAALGRIADWISDAGCRKLAEGGIAPPGKAPVRTTGPVPLQLGPTRRTADCPLCGSSDTEELSEFGATACKALRRCRSCREPFEHVKEI